MLNEIVKIFEPQITTLNWIEVYGGLAKVMTVGQKHNVVVPVVHHITEEECSNNKGVYKWLLPHKEKKSIIWFEEVGSVSIVSGQGSSRSRTNSYQGTVRLFVWLNMAELGFDSYSANHIIVNNLVEMFNRKNWGNNGSFLAIETRNVIIDDQATTKSLWNRFSFEKKAHLTMYPYEIASIQFGVSWKMGKNCQPEITIEDPIKCINYANSNVGES